METPNTTQLVHAELTKEIIGALFEVHNTLGGGLLEKHYQKALAEEFRKRKVPFVEQYAVDLNYKGTNIGRYFFTMAFCCGRGRVSHPSLYTVLMR